MRFQLRLRDLFIFQAMFCIAVAAMAMLPHQYFVLPVGLMTVVFLLIGQRKVALAFGSCFLASWVLVSVARLCGV